jgi:hypothetical protein
MLMWHPTIARCWYQLVTVATGENMMSHALVATDGHNNDWRFDDITEEPL